MTLRIDLSDLALHLRSRSYLAEAVGVLARSMTPVLASFDDQVGTPGQRAWPVPSITS